MAEQVEGQGRVRADGGGGVEDAFHAVDGVVVAAHVKDGPLGKVAHGAPAQVAQRAQVAAAGGVLHEGRREDAGARFHAEQVGGMVQRGVAVVAAARVPLGLEHLPRFFVLAFHDDEDAPRHARLVGAAEAVEDVEAPRRVEQAAVGLGAEEIGHFVDAGHRRVEQRAIRHHARGVGDHGHFAEVGHGTVRERGEHGAALADDLFRRAVAELPQRAHAGGGDFLLLAGAEHHVARGIIDEIVFAGFARAHDVHAEDAAPADEPDEQAGLVAVAGGVDEAAFGRLARQDGADDGVGFLGDHDDVHTALDGKLGGGCAGFGRSGAFHQHVEGEVRDVFEAVHDDVEAVGVSLLRILGGFAHADLGGGDARVFIGVHRALHGTRAHGGDFEQGHSLRLEEEGRTEFARAREAGLDRAVDGRIEQRFVEHDDSLWLRMKSRLRRERGALQAEGIPSRSVGVCEKAERLHEKVFAAEIARLEGKGKVRGVGVGRVEQRFRPRHAGRDGFADAQRAHAKAGHDRAGGFAPRHEDAPDAGFHQRGGDVGERPLDHGSGGFPAETGLRGGDPVRGGRGVDDARPFRAMPAGEGDGLGDVPAVIFLISFAVVK